MPNEARYPANRAGRSMTRSVLAEEQLHPAIRDRVASAHAATVHAVQAVAAMHPVLVVGMAGNPWCRRARRMLDGAGQAHHYLEYGSYLSAWQPRLALKMWTGWPTFPMVFVRGRLVGGAQDLGALMRSGELQRLLAG